MVLWWIANLIGLVVVIPLVVALASSVVRPAREIHRYADDILVHGIGITGHLDPLPELERTRTLVAETKANASGYVSVLQRRI